jgi:hypothetical protein
MMKASLIFLLLLNVGALHASAAQSIARVWDEETLSAIRVDKPHPPVHARNLFSVSVAMYDAWAAYDTVAVGFIYHGKHTAGDVAAARTEAISYATYRILKERYALSVNAKVTLPALDARLTLLGYDTNNASLDVSTPAGVGNSVAAAVSAWFINDGSRQLQGYKDNLPELGGYAPVNQNLVTGLSGIVVSNVNRWQPLAIADAVDQNGIPAGPIQVFLGSQWMGVRPFAMTRTDSTLPWIDPGPPPHLGEASDAEFRTNVVAVIQRSSELTPDDGVMVDVSPGAFGNNSLGTNDGTGHPLNPATGQPYAPNVVKRGDYVRILAEFWADGPNSETPPGHWNVIANKVADKPGFEKRIGGTGSIVDDLEWDVKVYFTLNAAVHDAACAAWGLKRYYDGWRPLSAIRYMGSLGQSSDPLSPAYNANGLPLIPGLIELVTHESSAPGERHEGLPLNKVVIHAWPGQPSDPKNQYSGVRWFRPIDWLPFQKKTFVTPAFPGYISGHSTFSRAAAEVLAAMTGSPYFPGGMNTYDFSANTFLTFEKGPSANLQLQWATYYDAADQAGLSRIWGGIHPPADDFTGRKAGSQCGKGVWALAQKYFDGSIAKEQPLLAIRRLDNAGCELRYETVRGFYYKVQASSDLSAQFNDDPAGFVQATDSAVARTNAFTGAGNFYRLSTSLNP